MYGEVPSLRLSESGAKRRLLQASQVRHVSIPWTSRRERKPVEIQWLWLWLDAGGNGELTTADLKAAAIGLLRASLNILKNRHRASKRRGFIVQRDRRCCEGTGRAGGGRSRVDDGVRTVEGDEESRSCSRKKKQAKKSETW